MVKNFDPVTGKVFSVFVCHAIPAIIGMLAMSCAVVVDGFFLGNYAGTNSLASVNLTIPASGLLFGLALMFSVGGAIHCGKYLGAGDFNAANGSFSQTCAFIALLAIVLTALGLIFLDRLVFLLGADKTLAPIVAEYMGILLFFTFFQFGAVCLSYFVRVANLPFWAAGAMVSGSLINIFLDWLFVVKYQMGHQGAAWGTGLAETATFFLLLTPFLAKRINLEFSWRTRDITEVLKAALNGFPEFFNEFSLGISMFIFNWVIMEKLGARGIAAFSIINYMFIAGLVVSYGISDSLQPVLSQNYGAVQPRRIRFFLLLATLSVFLVGTGISTMLAIKPQAVAGLFFSSAEMETIKLTNLFISRIWPVFILNGVNIVLATYLMAMRKCLDSALLILARNLLLPVIFLFIIQVLMGQDAILIVLPISELVTFFIAMFLLYRHSPKNLLNKASPLQLAAA